MTKIALTGGHHNAALVVADLLADRGHQVVWIGHRYASRGDHHDSAEYLEVNSHGYPFFDLQAGRFNLSLQEIIRLPGGLIQAYRLLKRERPTAVLTFGGYLGAAVSGAASLLGLPIYLHEQTISAGLANKLIGKIAKRIYLTWPSSLRYFNGAISRVVGLPLRPSILSGQAKSLFKSGLPTILVMGGKQGSHPLNRFIFRNLTTLIKHYNLIHQTGTSSLTGDYDQAMALKDGLRTQAENYLPLGYISEAEIGTYLRSSNFYLGRSGAHITYELAVLGIPAVLVPYLHTHDHEQLKNAQFLVSSGLGEIMTQTQLSLTRLTVCLARLKAKRITPLALPLDASEILVNDFLKDLRGD